MEIADFYSHYRIVTLKIKLRSSLLCAIILKIQYIKVGQNPLFSSRDNMRKPYFSQNLTFQGAGVTLK